MAAANGNVVLILMMETTHPGKAGGRAVLPSHGSHDRRHQFDIEESAMTEIDLLLTQIDQAYNRRSWHGTNLRGSVRGMTSEEAAWRPRAGRHSVQEIVVHAAYWKYAVRRRLTREKRGSFPLEGSNWFPRPQADANIWEADLRLLDGSHRQLRETIAALDPKRLHRTVGGSTTALTMVSGIIAHDLYHAGQIQLLKRMRADG